MTAGKQGRKHGSGEKKRDMPLREDGQVYARVTKMLGNGRLLAACTDGVERMCKIRGSMRKREWVRLGDVVLVALRDFQDTKADVVFKYQEGEVHRLKKLGEEIGAPVARTGDEACEDDDLVQFELGADDADDIEWDMI